MHRRDFLKLAGAVSLAGCASAGTPSKARVVVVGGGFGGATAAKYIRMWDPSQQLRWPKRHHEREKQENRNGKWMGEQKEKKKKEEEKEHQEGEEEQEVD